MSGDKFPMIITGVLTPFLLIISHYSTSIHSSIIPPPPPFNLSHFLYPKVTAFTGSDSPPPPPQFPPLLQGVLEAIAKKEKWMMDDVRVSKLDMKKVKYRPELRYELRVRFAKGEIVLKMYEEFAGWKKAVDGMKNGTLNFEALARIIASEAVIDSFKIEGPFELRVTNADDKLFLMLPLNTNHSGLKEISADEGITVEIKGAREISISHSPTISTHRHWYNVVSFLPDSCPVLTPIRIVGPASIFAHRNKRPSVPVQTAFTSEYSIKLLSDNCYAAPKTEKPRRPHLPNSLTSKIASLKRVLTSFLNDSDGENYASLKMRIKPLYVFHFSLELERDIRDDDEFWSSLAGWRTRPEVERMFFQVSARIENEELRPLVFKRVSPNMDTDTFAWSSLSLNVSFTKFPSVLVPPEALTLDVKW